LQNLQSFLPFSIHLKNLSGVLGCMSESFQSSICRLLVFEYFERFIPTLKGVGFLAHWFVKIIITPMISSLSILNYVYIDSEASVLGYGISLITLNIGMYFIVPAVAVYKVRKVISFSY
jgi:hypothetical protein